ncbi:cupredoxin domain-containing protein [Actinomadura chibensis]|uniref:Plastocyanin n=1 Tax=Actinomadura chibensis TaxID=392828 RepID=A0A5D0NI67_9ACTN|nr:cupredoxin family copper-binding protein [Actinomadura chibensis]TYB44117.1 plastocyanin [Actinomadura chibensis]
MSETAVRTRRPGVLALAGGLMLLLAACGGGTSHASGKSPSSTAPSSTAPASTAPSKSAPMPGMPMPSGSSAPAAPVAGNAVSIKGFAFVPATLTVHAGATVTWTNDDEEPHTVTSGTGPLRSPAMDAKATYRHRFARPGRYDYICTIHPFMHGTVVVKP